MKKFSKNTRMGTYAFGLSAVAVVIVLVLLSSGLRQVSAVSERARRQKRNANM